MAKNWTVKEASIVLANGKNKEDILDLGKRFPLATVVISKVGASCAAPGAFMELMKAMPDYLTMNKLNSALKDGSASVEDADIEDTEVEEDVEETKPVKKEKPVAKPAKKAEVEEDTNADSEIPDFESMTAQQMYDWGKARGIKFKSTKKADMIALLNEKFGGAQAETDEEEVEEAAEDEYANMSVKELFKECKERGIKAEIKKPAKYYIDLLKADDAAADEDSDEEDWEDEEEVEEKPVAKKSEKKTEKPVAKKPAKKAEPEEEEEDWDI